MEMTLSTWMKLAATATVISGLIWGLLFGEMKDVANAIASLMGGGTP